MNRGTVSYKKTLLTLSVVSVASFIIGVLVQYKLSEYGVSIFDHTGNTVWSFAVGTGFYGCSNLSEAIVCFARSFSSLAFVCVAIYMLSFTIYAYAVPLVLMSIISFVFGSLCFSYAALSLKYFTLISAGAAVVVFLCRFSSDAAVTGRLLVRKLPAHFGELLTMPDVRYITSELLLSSGRFAVVVIFSQMLLWLEALAERGV